MAGAERTGHVDVRRWLCRGDRDDGVRVVAGLTQPALGDAVDGVALRRIRDRPRHRRRALVLAASSGELMPVAQRSGARDDALRPRYERMEGVRDAWVANLKTFGVRHLFIAALSAYEIDYVWHTDGGFPVEDTWARSDPRSFRLEYENPQARVYAVDLP